MKKQYEEVVQERNSAVRERNGLKQQCTAAIRQWDIALRERNEYREALAKVSQQHEEAVKEINQAMVSRMKASKEIKRLTEERNAALHEYSLIMGERDNVHHEMETLGNDLSQAYAKVTHLENENKQLVEEVGVYCIFFLLRWMRGRREVARVDFSICMEISCNGLWYGKKAISRGDRVCLSISVSFISF